MPAHETTAFVVANAIVPALLYLGNIFVRLLKTAPITAGADWALLLLTFDLVAIIQHKEIGKFLRQDYPGGDPISLFLVLGIVGAFIYILNILFVEPAIERAQKTCWSLGPSFKLLSSISCTIGYTYYHLHIFGK